MAVTYGFFNSLNGDRVYSALQMGSIFDGIIYDGVYQSYGQAFAVTVISGLNIQVGTGRAWFNHTWTLNDAALGFTLSAAHATLNRYDEVILEVDTSDAVRANSIKILVGTAASSPSRPALTNTGTLKQYSLAYIYRPAASASVLQSNITMVVGTLATPWATSVLATNISFTQLVDSAGAASLHSQVFRGQNLGSAFTTDQKTAVQNGTFANLWLGDYWVISGVTWRIVDFDYWYGLGDTAFNSHHLVIMPDSSLYTSRMNSSATTTGGYVGSQMYTTNLNTAKTTINAAFPSAVLSHRDWLCNAVSSGKASNYGWYASTVALATEPMMFGSIYTGTEDQPLSTGQFSAMALMPKLRRDSANRHCLLQNVNDTTDWSCVNANGYPDYALANDASLGVRPVFCIG